MFRAGLRYIVSGWVLLVILMLLASNIGRQRPASSSLLYWTQTPHTVQYYAHDLATGIRFQLREQVTSAIPAPDSQRYAHTENRRGRFTIWFGDALGTALQELGQYEMSPLRNMLYWSADEQYLWALDEGNIFGMRLIQISTTTGELETLATFTMQQNFTSISPTNTQALLINFLNRDATLIDMATGTVMDLDRIGFFRWSDDGAYLAFTAWNRESQQATSPFMIYDANRREISIHGADLNTSLTNLRWTPDKQTIAYGDETGAYLLDIADDSVRRISPRNPAGLAWSPNQRYVLLRHLARQEQVYPTDNWYLLDMTTGAETYLFSTDPNTAFYMPFWTDDSAWLGVAYPVRSRVYNVVTVATLTGQVTERIVPEFDAPLGWSLNVPFIEWLQ